MFVGLVAEIVQSCTCAAECLRYSKFHAANFHPTRAEHHLGVFQRDQGGFTRGDFVVRNPTLILLSYGMRWQPVWRIRAAIGCTPDLFATDFSSSFNRAGKPITVYGPFCPRPRPDGTLTGCATVPDYAAPSALAGPVVDRGLALSPAANIPK